MEQLSVVIKFVGSALSAERESGNSKNYSRVVDTISQNKDPALSLWFTALAACVADLDERVHAKLLGILAEVSWEGKEAQVLQSLKELFVALSCCHSRFLPLAFSNLVKNMYPQDSVKQLEAIESRKHDDFLHETIDVILKKIPSSSVVLFRELELWSPVFKCSSFQFLSFLSNCLRIPLYAPYLEEKILALALLKMVEVDSCVSKVSASTDLIEEKSMIDSDEDEIEREKRTELVWLETEQKKKIDVSVLFFMQYLELRYKNSVQMGTTRSLLERLIICFESFLLKTHQTAFVQFVFLYATSLEHFFAETFVANLGARLFDPTENAVVRTNCARFIASFASHAAFFRLPSVLHIWNLLLIWAQTYSDAYDELKRSSRSEDERRTFSSKHQVFYSVCNALLYIFYSWHEHFQELLHADLVEIPNFAAPIVHLLSCSLDPLYFCDLKISKAVLQVLPAFDLDEEYSSNVFDLNSIPPNSERDSWSLSLPFQRYPADLALRILGSLLRGPSAS